MCVGPVCIERYVSYALCYELTSHMFLVEPTSIPGVKQLQVLLQFELVDSFDECPTDV